MAIVTLGIDLGKNVCSIAGLDACGRVVMSQRIRRFRLLSFLADLDPCVVAMEACGGAHHIARHCQLVGHEPRLMSPLYVRPYVKVHKTDDRDAEGIAEAATRPTMSFVAVKTAEQLDLQALHRSRERLIHNRTRLINQTRDFLTERGIRIGQHLLDVSKRQREPGIEPNRVLYDYRRKAMSLERYPGHSETVATPARPGQTLNVSMPAP